ncbi:MAG: response regulator [bacterium]|nr:response regulator [bacterium]
MNREERKLVVLMAEDNKHDILATKRAWKTHNIANPLHIVRDGEECLDYLYGRGTYSEPGSAPTPNLLLLDLKMPKLDGLGVLKAIRADEQLSHLPVVVLTTSDDDEDKAQSYNMGVNAYIRKPVGFDNFADAIKMINLFWELVDVPEEGRGKS